MKKKSAASKKKSKKLKPIKKDFDLMYEEMRVKVKRQEQLMGFSSVLNSSLEPALVQEKALIATCELLHCETATLYLLDPEKNELYFETVLGEAGRILQKTFRIPVNEESYAGLCAFTQKSFIKNDFKSLEVSSKNIFKKASSSTKYQTRSLMCVPLFAKGKLIGVLQSINKINGEFLKDDLALLESLSHQVAIAVENSRLYGELKISFYNTVEALTEAIEKKDRYTGGHSKRVAFYSVAIAEAMGLAPMQVDEIKLSAILHDIGKIGIEDKILKKGAALDEYEWPIMKEHPELGFEIMNKVKEMKVAVDGMRYHHERFDGKGYPKGLKGEEIPLVARIIAVADTYDAMVSTRPYRKGMDPTLAYEEVNKYSGTQFCPKVVQAFNKAYQSGGLGKKAKNSEENKVKCTA